MAYMCDPSNFVASEAREGRVGVSIQKATAEEKKLLLEAQQERSSFAAASCRPGTRLDFVDPGLLGQGSTWNEARLGARRRSPRRG